MATIRAYTDIEQSKKLAEILPIESADMCWSSFDEKWNAYLGTPNPCAIKKEIPCWSLAALLDVLPLEVSFNKQTDGVDTYYYIASCDARYGDVYSHRHINLVDACYEMIIKLNELNLL